MKTQLIDNLLLYETHTFKLNTLLIESHILKSNPLQDPYKRALPILSPLNDNHSYPVILILAGFTSNAPYYTNSKFNEDNVVQTICQAHEKGLAPEAHYVFVDALTAWGGSQFINSKATGDYENYIVQEVIPAIKINLRCSSKVSEWCIMGGSSGGYGALHLGSKYPDIIGVIAAIAPDSFFQASLLPEFYSCAPVWEKYQNAEKILMDLKSKKILKQKNWHTIINAIGMAACYAPSGKGIEILFPLDHYGELIPEVWSKILEHDPINFLKLRTQNITKSIIYIEVGQRDNFHLQFGSRQIKRILSSSQCQLIYNEFDGTHFDIGERRSEVWKWLTSLWRG
ncbi:MAG: alpha/beta hydrolase-fold protein [Pseudobdellovibrio sp.]